MAKKLIAEFIGTFALFSSQSARQLLVLVRPVTPR